MEDVQLQLAGLWIALMLVYLLGDVLRIFSGDYLRGGMNLESWNQAMWFGISAMMVMPIVMIVVTLLVESNSVNRWSNIIVAGFFFVFNLIGLPSYLSAYDKFLIVVGLVFNILTVIYAWNWS